MYATLLSILCRHEDALREIRLAVELDPISNNTRGQYALVLTRARKFDEAIKQSREAISLDSGFEVGYFRLAWALWGADKYDEAVGTMSLNIPGKYLQRNFLHFQDEKILQNN